MDFDAVDLRYHLNNCDALRKMHMMRLILLHHIACESDHRFPKALYLNDLEVIIVTSKA